MLITYKYQEWNGSSCDDNYRYNYTYDGSHIISTTQQSWNGSQWVNTQRYIYTWDNDLQLGYLSQTWNGSGWDDSYQGGYSYDENNNRTVESFQLWNETYNYWENYYRYLYGYILITDVEDESVTASDFNLSQNYPNPFNPTTNFEFRIADFEFVSLKVYDVLGNEMAILVNEDKPAGTYQITFDASELSSGVYFYKLQTGTFVETKKMILLR
jgi:hypothetical protein